LHPECCDELRFLNVLAITKMLRILRDKLVPWSTSSPEKWIRAVAERAIEELTGSEDLSTSTMGPAEARGYFRARARRVVQKHVAQLACEVPGLSPQGQAVICSSALEHVAHQLVRATRARSATQHARRLAA
jgi:hypothetical protein